ncbi:PREDICTED: uncharacterized protein LOC108559690 [Nicrophorus vespilloides]|uniref:Uncharacterized protein LOC108559690 n=1 Tax=Nicrophorus vespilloides TaxID=110193 RepID=A0ABM1MD75_NICVS|nr:PREDICTED: uncharacterized protein LOC108559690 [Nicrophorus vespilloides]
MKGEKGNLLSSKTISQADDAKYLGLFLDRRLTWKKHIATKRKQLGIKFAKLYWLIGKRYPLSYVTNDMIHNDLHMNTVKSEIPKFSDRYQNRLENHPNSLALSLLDNKDHEGSELTLMYEYAKRHNITINFKEKSPWGKMFANFTGIGLMGALAADEADIVFNFFTHRYGGFNGSDLMHLDSWSSLSGRFEHNLDLFPNKVEDQNGRILRAAAFTYIPYSNLDNGLGSEMQLAKEYARRHNNNLIISRDYPWGEVYGNRTGTGILGTVVRDETDFAFTGVFSWFRNHHYLDYSHDFMVSKVTCITPSPSYIGKIDTPKQLAESNLTWVGTQISSWTDNIIYDEQEEYKVLVKNAEELKANRLNDKTVAYAIEKLQTNYYAFDELITEKVIKSYRAMEEYMYFTHCIFAFRKNSVLLPGFNKLLLRAQASGLGLKWETDAIIQSSLRKQYAMDYENFKVRGNIRLNFPRFEGVLILWSCGLSIAIFCFLGELII